MRPLAVRLEEQVQQALDEAHTMARFARIRAGIEYLDICHPGMT